MAWRHFQSTAVKVKQQCALAGGESMRGGLTGHQGTAAPATSRGDNFGGIARQV